MSIEAVREYLRAYGMADRIQEFTVSSATVELAAAALSCDPACIAKTLSFRVDGHAVLIAAAGDARIDNAKFKAQFHTKAAMLAPDEIQPMTGHMMGGVCPFAVAEGAEVYLDVSLKRFEKIYPAAGSSNSAVGMSPDELAHCTGNAPWIDVCKLPVTV